LQKKTSQVVKTTKKKVAKKPSKSTDEVAENIQKEEIDELSIDQEKENIIPVSKVHEDDKTEKEYATKEVVVDVSSTKTSTEDKATKKKVVKKATKEPEVSMEDVEEKRDNRNETCRERYQIGYPSSQRK